MKALAIVAVLSGVAHADTLFATEDGGKLIVHQLAGDAITTVYEEPSTGVLEYAFADAKTLWVLRVKQGTFSVGTIAGGKAGPERVLTFKDWDGRTKGPPWPPHLMITKTHEVWVTRCVDRADAKGDALDELVDSGMSHCDNIFRRVDAEAPLTNSLSDFATVAAHWQPQWPYDPASGPNPLKGYTISVDRDFACRGPRNKLTLKLGTRWARHFGFIWADPPIVEVTVMKARGKSAPHFGHEDYYGQRDLANDDGTGMYFLEDCKTWLRGAIAIEPGVIATTEGDKMWRLRRGGKDLATFTATRVVAPAP